MGLERRGKSFHLDGRPATWLALAALACLPVYLLLPALFLGKFLYGYDTLALYLPFWTGIQRSLAAHEWPLWMPDVFGGMPGIAACNLQFLYPTELAAHLLKLDPGAFGAWNAAGHILLSGVGMFLFLRRLDRGVGAAFLGALFFAGSGQQVSQLNGGYSVFVEGIAWTPWAFWAVHKGVKEGSLAAWGAAGLAFALVILSLSIQLFTYLAVAVAAFAAAMARREGGGAGARRRAWAGPAVAVLTAGLVSAPQLWPTFRYLGYTSRHGASQAWVTEGSMRLAELFAWIVPGLFGWTGAGQHSFTTNYFGLLPWALACAAAVALWRREPWVRWMAGLALVSLFFAQKEWTPFYHLFRHIPGLSGFRLWQRILFLLTFAVCTAAAYGWDALREEALRPALARGGLGFLGLALVVAACAWRFAVPDGAAGSAAHDSGREALLVVPGALLVLALALWRPRSLLVLALAALVHVQDEGRVLRRYVRFIDPAGVAPELTFADPPPPPAQTEPWRVLDTMVYYSNDVMAYGYENLGGQASVLLADAQRIRDAMTERARDWALLMNVRYVLSHEGGRTGPVRVRELVDTFHRAWLVTRTRRVADDEAAAALLGSGGFNPRVEAALVDGPRLDGKPSRGGVTWLARSPQSSLVEAVVDQPSLLVYSNFWYPAWRCQVDGVPAPLLKVDGGLQAVALAPGRHRISIRYSAALFHAALAACAAGLLLLLALLFLRPRL